MKTCRKCGFVGEDTEFISNRNLCRPCNNTKCKEYRKAHVEEFREYDRARKKKRAEHYLLHREEMRAQMLGYRQSHKEEIRNHNAEYRKNNREKILERGAEYRQSHKKETKERSIKYSRANRPRLNAKWSERHRDLKRRMLACDPKEIEAFYIEAERLTKETGIRYSVDHIIPVKGKTAWGLHVPWNLQVIPLDENRKKLNKLDESYISSFLLFSLEAK